MNATVEYLLKYMKTHINKNENIINKPLNEKFKFKLANRSHLDNFFLSSCLYKLLGGFFLIISQLINRKKTYFNHLI